MTQTALVLGSGPCARKVAGDLLASGIEVILASGDSSAAGDAPGDVVPVGRMSILENAEVSACRGAPGDYRVTFGVEGRSVRHHVGAIVIAEDDVRRPNQGLYGLTLCDSVVPLSRLSATRGAQARDAAEAVPLEGVKKAVLISGAADESCAAVAGEVMEAAIRLQSESGIQTYVLAGNLKVAGEGLEAAYRRAKTAGTVFFKFDNQAPEFKQGADGRVEVAFQDPILGQACRLTPDLCVLDEAVRPSTALARIAAVFELQTGADGFIQTDNVHRQTVFTLRKGIFAVGPSRCVQAADAHLIDAANAALAVFGLLGATAPDSLPTAEIDRGHCVRCLTCYRLCPYRAVVVDIRPAISGDACAGCGICAAECPRGAIHLAGLANDDMAGRMVPAAPAAGLDAPRMIAFCCSRSAAQAAQLAACCGKPLPQGLTLVEVPCAGGISLEHLLTAFRKKADGVLVLTCHTDNCHSEHGNRYARLRVDHLRGRLSAVGLDPRRLLTASLAANMGREFHDIVSNFETTLGTLNKA